MNANDASIIFDRLKTISVERGQGMNIFVDREGDFVNEPPQKQHEHEFFTAVKVKKTYVSFHLLPVKNQPALLDGISPTLRKRMQGKSCFNFTKVDDVLFAELGDLVERAAQHISNR